MKFSDRAAAYTMYLILLLFGIVTYSEVKAIRQDVAAMKADTEEGIDSLHLLTEQRGVNIYTIQDTLVRIFHYVQPHKGHVNYCPECMKHTQARERDFKQPLDENDVVPGKGYVPPENREELKLDVEEPDEKCATRSPSKEEQERVEAELKAFRQREIDRINRGGAKTTVTVTPPGWVEKKDWIVDVPYGDPKTALPPAPKILDIQPGVIPINPESQREIRENVEKARRDAGLPEQNP